MSTPQPMVELLGEGKEPEFGICDECGEYVGRLVLLEEEWVCQNCERFR